MVDALEALPEGFHDVRGDIRHQASVLTMQLMDRKRERVWCVNGVRIREQEVVTGGLKRTGVAGPTLAYPALRDGFGDHDLCTIFPSDVSCGVFGVVVDNKNLQRSGLQILE